MKSSRIYSYLLLTSVTDANAAGLIHLLPPGPKTKTGGAISASPSKDDCGPPFEWLGTWHRPPVPGSDIGARLYIGRKRMFKGPQMGANTCRSTVQSLCSSSGYGPPCSSLENGKPAVVCSVDHLTGFFPDTRQKHAQSSKSYPPFEEYEIALLTGTYIRVEALSLQ